MDYEIIKVWKDDKSRRWYLTDLDEYPYINATTPIGVAKAFRYRNYKNDEKSEKRKKRAGKRGTDVHSVLEKYNREQLGQDFKVSSKLLNRYKWVIDEYKQLVKDIENESSNKVEVADVERSCVNPYFKYAGRFDLLVKIGDEYEIWDYKTSRWPPEEDGWQLAAYMMNLLIEGIPVKRCRIIHIDMQAKTVKDRKFYNHIPMMESYLCALEVFRKMHWNDLLNGRVYDLDELGKKYRWPKEEMKKNYVIEFNNKKEEIMELQEVTGLGAGQRPTRDPNKVDFSKGPVFGVVLGHVPNRWVHKSNTGKKFLCPGKDKCDRCKLGMKKSIEFKANFLTLDDADKPVIKYIDSGSVRLYFALVDTIKEIKANGGDVKTAVLKIERSGEGFKTQYAVEEIDAKHAAFQDIAATVKDMTPHDLTFDATEEETDSGNQTNTDIVES